MTESDEQKREVLLGAIKSTLENLKDNGVTRKIAKEAVETILEDVYESSPGQLSEETQSHVQELVNKDIETILDEVFPPEPELPN